MGHSETSTSGGGIHSQIENENKLVFHVDAVRAAKSNRIFSVFLSSDLFTMELGKIFGLLFSTLA